jgi:hypothetical protein
VLFTSLIKVGRWVVSVFNIVRELCCVRALFREIVTQNGKPKKECETEKFNTALLIQKEKNKKIAIIIYI